MLHSEFEKFHARFRTVSIIHLKELQTELNDLKINGFITETFFQHYFSDFSFKPPKKMPHASSVIIIGVPQKIIPVNFSYKKKQYQTVLPPTYTYSKIRTTCKEILTKVLENKGYSVDRAILPLKLLAVRSGLAKYGKNNICYVDGMGSLTRLEAFYTDYESFPDDWHEKQVMKSCATCSLCQKICPTQCIPKERFLIHADHCLTYINENKGNFPPWISKQSHNALVGCMHCQIICPQNKAFLQLDRQPLNLTKEETSVILYQTPRKYLSQELLEKLNSFEIDEYYSILGRNLSVLMKK